MNKSATINFDKFLVDEIAPTMNGAKNKLIEWAKTESLANQRLQTSEVLISIANDILHASNIKADNNRIKAIFKNFYHFEQLAKEAKTGLGRQFYRGHVNHMLRVYLLEKYMGMKLESLDIDYEVIGLEALFHDIAYPIEQIKCIIGEIDKAFANCFLFINHQYATYSYSFKEVFKTLRFCGIDISNNISKLSEQIECNNHAFLSATEFYNILKKPFKNENLIRKIVRAIISHDCRSGIRISLKEYPRAALLLIADEIQEWGRPTLLELKKNLQDVDNFRVDKNSIRVSFDYSNNNLYFPTVKLLNKFMNLKRIDIDLDFCIEFEIRLHNQKEYDLHCENFQTLETLKVNYPSISEQIRTTLGDRLFAHLVKNKHKDRTAYHDNQLSELIFTDEPAKLIKLAGYKDVGWKMTINDKPLKINSSKELSNKCKQSLKLVKDDLSVSDKLNEIVTRIKSNINWRDEIKLTRIRSAIKNNVYQFE